MRCVSLFFSITARRHFGTQDRTRYLFIAQKALRTWNLSYRKWRQVNPIRYRWFPRKMADCEGDVMFLASEYEGPVLPWDRFRRWVTCFCVVTFDLELGQALEVSTSECFIDCVHASRSAVLGTERRLFKRVIIYGRFVTAWVVLILWFVFTLLQLVYPTHVELTDREVSKVK